MCFPLSFATTRKIFWTWWNSSDWSSSLPNLQETKYTLYPVNFKHRLTIFAKLSLCLQNFVHCTFVFQEVLFLMVSFHSLCLDVFHGALQLDSDFLTCSMGHLDSSSERSKITSWSFLQEKIYQGHFEANKTRGFAVRWDTIGRRSYKSAKFSGRHNWSFVARTVWVKKRSLWIVHRMSVLPERTENMSWS